MSIQTTSHSSGSDYRADIDGLRAVSVLGVLAFHLGAAWLPGGFVGVDVFFVISGFLITGIIARESDDGAFTYAGFYERRIRRIYPALIVVLLVTLIAAYIVMMPADFRLFGRTLVWTPLFASNFAFMGQTGYFDPDSSLKPLLHTWSLGVEEQFYIVFPLVLMGAKRFGVDRTRLVIGLVVASLAASIVTGAFDYPNSYYLLPTRFWELGCGALLALVPWRPASEGARSAIGAAGLAAIVLSMLFIDESMPFPGWVAMVPVFGACAVLGAQAGPARRLLATGPMTFIGRISYPMYLWHWPLIVFGQMYLFHPLTGVEAIGVAVLTVLAAWATMVVVEKPIRSRAWLAGKKPLFIAAAIFTLILVGAGLAVFNFKNLNRWTSAEQEALVAVTREGVGVDDLCPQAESGIAVAPLACRIGVVGATAPPPSFALLGDSHARAVGGAVSDAGARLGLSGLYFGRIACPTLTGVEFLSETRRHCSEHLARSVEVVRASGVRTVVLASRWAIQVTGHDYGRSPAEIHPVLLDGRSVRESDRRRVVRTALEAVIDAFRDRTVVIVDSVPEVRFDVPTVYANAMRLGRTPPSGPTRAEFDRRQVETRALLREIAASRPWVRIVEPADVLCGPERCRIFDGAVPLYSDADHLSRAGAKQLVPLFEEVLRPAP